MKLGRKRRQGNMHISIVPVLMRGISVVFVRQKASGVKSKICVIYQRGEREKNSK